jgi:hypothetical protein
MLKEDNSGWWVRRASPRRGFKDVREQVVAGRWDAGLVVREVTG